MILNRSTSTGRPFTEKKHLEGELLGGGGELHSVRIQAAAGWAREANHILAPGTEANQPKLM